MATPAGQGRPAGHDPRPFEAVPRAAGDAVLVGLHGELDLASADVARRALAEARTEAAALVAADLTHVTMLDSTGLGVLLDAARSCGPDRFALICPGGLHARGVLSISGALDRLLVVESEAELRRHLGAPSEEG